MKKEVVVEGMKCAGCANAVQERFAGIAGVDSVDIDLENKKAIIDSDGEIEIAQLDSVLADTKYSVVG